MGKGCFCHFNGFEVKDAYARSLVGVHYRDGSYYRMVEDEMEFINPPMVPGQEYRTTERYNGLPVYVKLFEKVFEDGAQASNVVGTYPADAEVVSIEAFEIQKTNGGDSMTRCFPLHDSSGTIKAYVSAHNTRHLTNPEGYPDADVYISFTDDFVPQYYMKYSVKIKYVKP